MLAVLWGAAAAAAPVGCGGFDGWVGRYDWCVDGALAGSLAAGAALTTQLKPPVARRLAFDRRSDDAFPRLSAPAATTSDWLSPAGLRYGTGVPITLGAVGAAAVVGAAQGDAGGPRLEGALAGALASVEAISLSLTAAQTLQAVVGRPRPYTSEAFEEAYPDWSGPFRNFHAGYRSMPDAHTAATAAALFTPATLWGRAELQRGPSWRLVGPAAATGVAIGVTGGVAWYRVLSGLHHRDDVYVGLLLGTTVGVAVPLLHGLTPVPLVLTGDGAALVGTW